VAGLVFVIPERWFKESPSGNPFIARSRWVKWGFYFFLTVNVLTLVVASVRPPIPAVSVHQYIHGIAPAHFEFYSLGSSPYYLHQDEPLRFEFYAPEKITHHVLGSLTELPAVLENHAPIYFYHHDQILPGEAAWDILRERCKAAYRSFPEILNNWNYRNWMTRAQSSSIYECE